MHIDSLETLGPEQEITQGRCTLGCEGGCEQDPIVSCLSKQHVPAWACTTLSWL